MELVRWDQVEGVNRIQSRINELFEDTFGRTRAQQSAATGFWCPPVDILESKDSYLIRVDLPGMRNEDLKTEVNEGILTLSGERQFEEPANGVEYHRESGDPPGPVRPGAAGDWSGALGAAGAGDASAAGGCGRRRGCDWRWGRVGRRRGERRVMHPDAVEPRENFPTLPLELLPGDPTHEEGTRDTDQEEDRPHRGELQPEADVDQDRQEGQGRGHGSDAADRHEQAAPRPRQACLRRQLWQEEHDEHRQPGEHGDPDDSAYAADDSTDGGGGGAIERPAFHSG